MNRMHRQRRRIWTGDALAHMQTTSWTSARRRSTFLGRSKQRRGRCRRRAVPAAFSFAEDCLRSLSELLPAALPRKALVQSGLAMSERDCGLRVWDPTDERSPPTQRAASANKPAQESGAPVPAGTGTSEQILLAASRKPARQPIGGEKRRTRCRRCAIPAAVLTPGTYLCSLSASASLTHPRKFPSLSQRNRRPRVRHLADLDIRPTTNRAGLENGSPQRGGVHQSSVFCKHIHPSRHKIQTIFVRSVLAQDSADMTLVYCGSLASVRSPKPVCPYRVLAPSPTSLHCSLFSGLSLRAPSFERVANSLSVFAEAISSWSIGLAFQRHLQSSGFPDSRKHSTS